MKTLLKIHSNIVEYILKSSIRDLFAAEQEWGESGGTANSSTSAGRKQPWLPLPSITDFNIRLGPLDWLFALFGMWVRIPSRVQLKPWRNSPPNRYVGYMFQRLRYHATKAATARSCMDADFHSACFWRVAWSLMRSEAYQIVCYNAVRRR